MSAVYCPPDIVQGYLNQINSRNKDEKEFFKSFVSDYHYVLSELKECKRELSIAKIENDQIKTLKGDPVLLRKTQEELDKVKS